jgi:hypothetical protein
MLDRSQEANFMAVTYLARMALVGACLLLGACSSGEIASNNQPMGLGCVDDSPHCVTERGNALKGLMADKSKAWVREPASPAAYASGVRLWAFKQKKRELSCDELSLARREADGAAPTLRGAKGGLTPAQISRGIMLAQDVSKELGNEFGRRCRA